MEASFIAKRIKIYKYNHANMDLAKAEQGAQPLALYPIPVSGLVQCQITRLWALEQITVVWSLHFEHCNPLLCASSSLSEDALFREYPQDETSQVKIS
jgi:hypothetical protein